MNFELGKCECKCECLYNAKVGVRLVRWDSKWWKFWEKKSSSWVTLCLECLRDHNTQFSSMLLDEWNY